jgi:hypothetical protein
MTIEIVDLPIENGLIHIFQAFSSGFWGMQKSSWFWSEETKMGPKLQSR